MTAAPASSPSPYLTRSVTDAPVGLLIVSAGNRVNATTVSCFSEVAHHPTALWVSLAEAAYSRELLGRAGRFSLATLHPDQAGIAMACGTRSGRVEDKCSGLGLYDHGDGFLFLPGALASTACVVDRSIALGDHTLFLALIRSGEVDTRRAASRPLLLSDLRTP